MEGWMKGRREGEGETMRAWVEVIVWMDVKDAWMSGWIWNYWNHWNPDVTDAFCHECHRSMGAVIPNARVWRARSCIRHWGAEAMTVVEGRRIVQFRAPPFLSLLGAILYWDLTAWPAQWGRARLDWLLSHELSTHCVHSFWSRAWHWQCIARAAGPRSRKSASPKDTSAPPILYLCVWGPCL